MLIVDMNEKAANATKHVIKEAGGEASTFIADVVQESACKTLVDTSVERYGRLDILMNSVGIGGPGATPDVTQDSWNRVLDVDLKSMVFISKYAIPEMIKTGGGSIINVASVDGIRAAMTKNVPYAAAKGGMIAATRAMAVHHGRTRRRTKTQDPTRHCTSRHRRESGRYCDGCNIPCQRRITLDHGCITACRCWTYGSGATKPYQQHPRRLRVCLAEAIC